jgi:predicted DsbA family dithiol-disulfide isomerase
MPTAMKIDFVSDVMCPWCVIGLKALEQALDKTRDVVNAELHFQPFELNPQMPAEGQDVVEHIAQKYGSTPEQMESNREAMRARGAELGFTFDMKKRGRIYNTFDAHRLLHWAESAGHQQALKQALFDAYFTEGRNPSDHAVLIDVVGKVGLDRERAQAILSSDEFAKETREREQFYIQSGIQAVPSVIINDRHLIQGGQPVETFERILRQLAEEISRAA